MQNIWLKSWDQDKFIEKKLKKITKLILKKKKYRMIRLHEVET
jgi:hypothetical protein